MDDMQTMLASAIEDLDIELARMLIVENDVEPKNVDEEAMLLFIQSAITSNDKPLLQRLLKYDRRLNGRILWNMLDNVEVATMIVRAGADLTIPQNDSNASFLHVLLESEDPSKFELAELMIDNNADLSVVNHKERSVLHHAIEVGAPIDFIRKMIWNSVADFETNSISIADSDRCAELMPLIISFITANSIDEVTRIRRVKDAIFFLSSPSVRYHESRKIAIKALLNILPTSVFDSSTDETMRIDPILGGQILWYVIDDIEVATMLVSAGANLSVQQDDTYTCSFLHFLVMKHDASKLELAELMINQGANVSAVDYKKRSVLECAIEAGVPKDFIGKLLWSSFEDFAKNAVIIADSKRQEELIPELIGLITNEPVDDASRNKMVKAAISLLTKPSTLYYKSRKVTIEALLRLVVPHIFDSKVAPELNNVILKDTRLIGKILWYMFDDLEVATMLVCAGANLDVRHDDFTKTSFLHALVATNDPDKLELAELMIDLNADVNAIDHYGHSVLQYAIELGVSEDFIRKIIWSSVANFAKNAVTTVDSGRNEELLPILVSFILDDSVDDEKRSAAVKDAIHLLIDKPSKGMTESRRKGIVYLLEYAMPVNMFDSKAYRTLGGAIVKENYEFVKLLLQCGADPNSKEYRNTPHLCFATKMKKSSMAMLLIKFGADINHLNEIDERPIHYASRGNSVNNLLLLVRLGADVNVVDKSGQTLLGNMRWNLETGMNEQYYIVIRRLALVVFKGTPINIRDKNLIKNTPVFKKIFDSCLNELNRMQEMEIVKGISYSNFLVENVEKISKYKKREDLINIFEDKEVILKSKELFPCYHSDFQDAYFFAEELKHSKVEKKEFLNVIFLEIYQITLPDLVIDKIVDYLIFDQELKDIIL